MLDTWLRLGNLLVSLLGFGGLIWTIRQKTISDNRAEWWKRYTWATDLVREEDDRLFRLGTLHLGILLASPLATKTEQRIVQELAVFYESEENGEEEKEVEDDNQDDR